MAGTVKKLQFSEGTDVGAPSDLSLQTSTSVILAFANDAAFVASEGAAAEGHVYLNTTDEVFRMYLGGAWRSAVPQSDAADATKKFLVDLTGNSTGVTATLDFNATANRIYTFPDAATTIVGTDVAQILTNKTINASNNTVTNVSLSTGVTDTLPIANGGTGETDETAAFDALAPTTTKGDVIAFDGTNNIRLAVGTDGFALTASSAAASGLAWTSVLSNPMTTQGDIIYGGASGVGTRLAAGASDSVLVGGSTPSWSNTPTLESLTIDTSAGNNLILNKAGGASLAWQAAGSTSYSIDVNSGSLRFLQAGSNVKMTLSSAGVLTVSSQSLILTDSTSSGTTELRVLSNATNGTSKFSFGHVSTVDAAYMSYNVATGVISFGTNGEADNLTISTNQLFFDGSGGESEFVLGNNNSVRGASFRYVTSSGILQIATNGSDPAAATSAMSVGTSQLVTFGIGVALPTSGGTATTLDYYEQGSLNPAFTMNSSGNSTGSVVLGFTRIGNIVSIYLPALLAQSDGVDAALSATTIPTRLLPTTDQFFVVGRGVNNGTNDATPCTIRVHASTGAITVYRDALTNTAWSASASANCGLANPITITYKQ